MTIRWTGPVTEDQARRIAARALRRASGPPGLRWPRRVKPNEPAIVAAALVFAIIGATIHALIT